MSTFLRLLFMGIVILSIIIKNIYLFIVLLFGFTIYSLYESIKNIVSRRNSKRKVSSKIDLYCKEFGALDSIWMFFYIIIIAGDDINFKYIVKNFSRVSFSDQLSFVFSIFGFIWILFFLTVFIYSKSDSKKGIVYKEGLILENGKLYSFDSIKSYEFKVSGRGIKYSDLVLTFDGKTVKKLYVYKDDTDKFKELLDKNKAI
ncbi:hypothetical protein [Clostridium sp. CCUG 7971]|uniref:hypothetical protein n=1 Tax=Clostridium sp. CCUG 7971 TaxID=2811414 RepID=UPI001ABB5D1F|nr:hypothetical protein [Clostridium sp. CCUG 7971]MBO3443908.1 hypothetical protein [Clostridium sp. CCUG 7971]